jgi:hypothetical protein
MAVVMYLYALQSYTTNERRPFCSMMVGVRNTDGNIFLSSFFHEQEESVHCRSVHLLTVVMIHQQSAMFTHWISAFCFSVIINLLEIRINIDVIWKWLSSRFFDWNKNSVGNNINMIHMKKHSFLPKEKHV